MSVTVFTAGVALDIAQDAAVLKTSENAEAAAKFMKEFLETDFAAFGFAPKNQVVGTLPF